MVYGFCIQFVVPSSILGKVILKDLQILIEKFGSQKIHLNFNEFEVQLSNILMTSLSEHPISADQKTNVRPSDISLDSMQCWPVTRKISLGVSHLQCAKHIWILLKLKNKIGQWTKHTYDCCRGERVLTKHACVCFGSGCTMLKPGFRHDSTSWIAEIFVMNRCSSTSRKILQRPTN